MSSGRRNGLQSEINVTPLIDVLLVLLIIFLMVMPIVLHQEPLDIPREGDDRTEPEPSLTVVVQADLSIELTDEVSAQPVTIAATDFSSALRARFARSSAKIVFVDFAPSVPWHEAVAAMDRIRGVTTDAVKVALKVRPDETR